MAIRLLTQTFDGLPGGMNLALPANEISDAEARYIQDALLDIPGQTRRRGPVTAALNIATPTRKVSGIVTTINPQGQTRYAILSGDTTHGYFEPLSDTSAAIAATLTLSFPLPSSPSASAPYRIVDAKPALGGGVWVGVSSSYDAAPTNQDLLFWYGGNKPDYTVTISATRGTHTVTGTGFSANVVPGMFLLANTDNPYSNAYFGVVKSVDSDNQVTMMTANPYTSTSKSATFTSIRGPKQYPDVVTGRITCDTSLPTVNGGDTKFLSQGLNTGSWDIYRFSDLAWVGKVSSVQSEIYLTLAANAAISLADEAYIALNAGSNFFSGTSTETLGFLNAVYAERQWFGNNGSTGKTSTVWFSDINDPEAVDTAFDGDSIDIDYGTMLSEPIRALSPAYNALIVLKENESYGIFGATPSQFTVRKLGDDGTLSGMSVQNWNGGVIWAGREGIHFYDGAQVQNLTINKLGTYWKDTIRTFDPTKYRMWSMLDRDHYFLFIENISPTVPVIKGSTSSTPTKYTLCLNLFTGAITFLTNVDLRGAVVLPGSAGKKVWYVVNDTTKGYICDGEALFNQEGVDTITCENSATGLAGTVGPDMYVESKAYDMGDALRLKRYRWLAMEYLVANGNILVDRVLGLNDIGTPSTSVFAASTYSWDTLRTSTATWNALKTQFPTWNSVVGQIFVPGKAIMSRKSQFIRFRLYQSTSAITHMKIGPFQIGFRVERAGRLK